MAAIDAEHYIDGLPQHLGEPDVVDSFAEEAAAPDRR
jgi:hypothetical protein